MSKLYGRITDNDWNTPEYVWDYLIDYEIIPRDKTIWLPFYNDGECGNYLRKKNFNIIHKNEDFFQQDYGDIVIDNPPYMDKNIPNVKLKIMERLIKLNKPFMLLFPSSTIQTKYFHKLVHKHENFQLIIPKEKYNFEKHKGDKTKCLFYTLWVCWNMNFESDYYII